MHNENSPDSGRAILTGPVWAPLSATPDPAPPAFDVIYSYSRSQAIADGFQIEVTKVARQAGISFPVCLTRAVFENYVAVPPGVTAQDEPGRLWDIVWMTRFAILRMRSPRRQRSEVTDRISVSLYVRNDNRRARLVKL